jgi:hypothetical protein
MNIYRTINFNWMRLRLHPQRRINIVFTLQFGSLCFSFRTSITRNKFNYIRRLILVICNSDKFRRTINRSDRNRSRILLNNIFTNISIEYQYTFSPIQKLNTGEIGMSQGQGQKYFKTTLSSTVWENNGIRKRFYSCFTDITPGNVRHQSTCVSLSALLKQNKNDYSTVIDWLKATNIFNISHKVFPGNNIQAMLFQHAKYETFCDLFEIVHKVTPEQPLYIHTETFNHYAWHCRDADRDPEARVVPRLIPCNGHRLYDEDRRLLMPGPNYIGTSYDRIYQVDRLLSLPLEEQEFSFQHAFTHGHNILFCRGNVKVMDSSEITISNIHSILTQAKKSNTTLILLPDTNNVYNKWVEGHNLFLVTPDNY